MTKELPAGAPLPTDVPLHQGFSATFMTRLLWARMAMGLHVPQLDF